MPVWYWWCRDCQKEIDTTIKVEVSDWTNWLECPECRGLDVEIRYPGAVEEKQ